MFVNGLQSKVAIVTGGSRGLGYVIAQRFVAEGASVAVLGLHPESVARVIESPWGAFIRPLSSRPGSSSTRCPSSVVVPNQSASYLG